MECVIVSLFGKKVSTDVIFFHITFQKEIILDCLGGPKCYHIHPYEKEADRGRYRRKGDVKMEAVTDVMSPQERNASSHQKLEDARNGFSP